MNSSDKGTGSVTGVGLGPEKDPVSSYMSMGPSLECGSRLESLDQQMKSQEGLSGFHPDKKLQSPGLPLEMVRSLSLEGWRD